MSSEALEAGFKQSLAQSSTSEISESLGEMLAALNHEMSVGIKHDAEALGIVHMLYQACHPEDQKRHLPAIEKLTQQFEKSQYKSFSYLDQLRQLQPESSRNTRAIEAAPATEQPPVSTKTDAQREKDRARKKRKAERQKAALQDAREQTKQAQLEAARMQVELEKIRKSAQQTRQKLRDLQRQKKPTPTASSGERAGRLANPFHISSGTQINHTTAISRRPASRASTATANSYRGKHALENWEQLTPKDKQMIYGIREKNYQNTQHIRELTGIIATLTDQLKPFKAGQIQDAPTHEDLTTQLLTAQQLLQEAHEPEPAAQSHSTALKPASPRLLSRSMNNLRELLDEQPEAEYSETEADNPEGSPVRKTLSFSDMRSLQKPDTIFQ